MVAGFIFAALLATSSRNDANSWNSWFSSVNIEKVQSSIQVLSIEKSVASRGVFANESFDVGETIVKIPSTSIFTPKTAKKQFPKPAKELSRCRRRERGILGIHSVWKYIKRRKEKRIRNYSWPAELTAYALQAIEEEHSWATWISDWQRDDPVSSMFERCVRSTNTQEISKTAIELHKINPALSRKKIEIELKAKLLQFEEHKRIYNLKDDARTAKLYSTLSSRVMYLGSGTPGVIPMYDMINHSLDPNVGLSFDGEKFFVYALHDISEGEELLVCYIDTSQQFEWDQDLAMSTLLTWGIPYPPTPEFGLTLQAEKPIPHEEALHHNMTPSSNI